MCGLFGAISTKLFQNELDNVLQLGVMASLRGRHSTGIAAFRKHKGKVRYEIQKDTVPSSELLYRNEVQSMFKGEVFLVIGHCRYATCGEVNKHNAHPIWDRNVIGCHNGVIRRFEPPANLRATETDSRELIRKLANTGVSALKEVGGDGAYALTYVDLADQTFNLIRNSKRPLHIMFSSNADTMYWASERGMLTLLKERAGNMKDPVSVDEGHLIKFKMGTMECKVSKPDVAVTYSYVPQAPRPGMGTTPGGVISSAVPLVPGPGSVEIGTPRPFVPGAASSGRYRAFGGRSFPKEMIEKIVQREGCAGCTRHPPLTEDIAWFDNTTFLCDECMSIAWLKETAGMGDFQMGELIKCN